MNTNENKRPLMKHFSAVFRRRALATTEVKETISPLILKFFSRKDLIQIIKDKYDGTIPKEHDLMELENVDLLTIIEDDIFIISYMTKQWAKQQILKVTSHDKKLINEMDVMISKTVKNEQKSKKEVSKDTKTVKKK